MSSTRFARLSPRGWSTNHGGRPAWVQPPTEFQGTTVQVCGLWPFSAGSGTPMIGVPIGRDINTGRPVCCDPYNWFRNTNLISNPSEWIQGRPGLGKSSLVRRQALGLAAGGVQPLVLGDLKPDYRDLVEALDGNVVSLGPGRAAINPLDPGRALTAAKRLKGDQRRALVADVGARRLQIVATLLELNRGAALSDVEEAVLATAIDSLDKTHEPGTGTLRHLIEVLAEPPTEVQNTALAQGKGDGYQRTVGPLQASLWALCTGPLGDMFARPTSTPLDLSKPLCIDISSIGVTNEKLTAAALLVCWSEGFASIAAEHALSDVGKAPQRHWFVILDELWRALSAAPTIAARVDGLTRINRTDGVATAMITHTQNDDKYLGLAERAGLVITAGVPKKELPRLEEIVSLTEKERSRVTQWDSPPAWNSTTRQTMAPPGQGQFLIKVGARPGIAVKVRLTKSELVLHNTNKRW